MQNKVNTLELPVVFDCQGDQLIGIINQTNNQAKVGILIIVGGPQYRVGSHRQFLLLARQLAEQGIPTMRFDFRGMGDSSGERRNFEQIEDDIAAAVDIFIATCPTLKNVVLWGLCDGASAAIFYAYKDSRINGLVLLNPWVYTQQGAAKTYLKHYYLRRLFNKDFWTKVFLLKFDYVKSVVSLFNMLKHSSIKTEKASTINKIDENLALPIRMRECLKQFAYPVLFILSGRDLTADEFQETVKSDLEWKSIFEKSHIERQFFAEADHTFSSAGWRNQISLWTTEWVNKLKLV